MRWYIGPSGEDAEQYAGRATFGRGLYQKYGLLRLLALLVSRSTLFPNELVSWETHPIGDAGHGNVMLLGLKSDRPK